MEVLVVIIGMVALISFISWVVNISRKATRYDELKPRLEDLDNYQGRLAQREQELERRKKEWNEKVQSDIKAVHTLAEEKSEGFPWLAEAYADYFHLQDQKAAKHLRTKKHPARKAAEEVRKIARQRRVAEKLYRVLKYQLEYYENLFPWLVDFKGEDLDDLIRQILERKEKGEGLPDEPDDPVRKWLTAAE
jgi:DNA repair exonuclease SbcCD ATPase subunit